MIVYHSKRLPPSTKNFGITELELTGLLVNIHGFMQLLCNRYFEVLVDHKAIEYMIKSKTESPTTRLKTLLLKLSEYTINLKYQKGSEMHTSDALSRHQNIADTPDNKDVIPLNILQHLAQNYIEHIYVMIPGLRSDPTESQYIHCLQRGGGVALIQTQLLRSPLPKGCGGAQAIRPEQAKQQKRCEDYLTF